MRISRFVGPKFNAAYALGAVLMVAVALTALGSFVPDEALSALRSLIPSEAPFLQLLLLGWIGVALGRMTTRAESGAAARSSQASARRDTAARDEKVDRVLRHVAKVLQAHWFRPEPIFALIAAGLPIGRLVDPTFHPTPRQAGVVCFARRQGRLHAYVGHRRKGPAILRQWPTPTLPKSIG
jgi:hypothetical protein